MNVWITRCIVAWHYYIDQIRKAGLCEQFGNLDEVAGRNREGEDRLGSCKAIRCLLMSPIPSITPSGPR